MTRVDREETQHTVTGTGFFGTPAGLPLPLRLVLGILALPIVIGVFCLAFTIWVSSLALSLFLSVAGNILWWVGWGFDTRSLVLRGEHSGVQFVAKTAFCAAGFALGYRESGVLTGALCGLVLAPIAMGIIAGTFGPVAVGLGGIAARVGESQTHTRILNWGLRMHGLSEFDLDRTGRNSPSNTTV